MVTFGTCMSMDMPHDNRHICALHFGLRKTGVGKVIRGLYRCVDHRTVSHPDSHQLLMVSLGASTGSSGLVASSVDTPKAGPRSSMVVDPPARPGLAWRSRGFRLPRSGTSLREQAQQNHDGSPAIGGYNSRLT